MAEETFLSRASRRPFVAPNTGRNKHEKVVDWPSMDAFWRAALLGALEKEKKEISFIRLSKM
jgi:hypothetical protein